MCGAYQWRDEHSMHCVRLVLTACELPLIVSCIPLQPLLMRALPVFSVTTLVLWWPWWPCDNTGAVVAVVAAVVVIITGVVMVMTYLVLRYKKRGKM